MKVVKIGSTLITGYKPLTRGERTSRRRKAIDAQERSKFTPKQIQKPTGYRLKSRAKEMRRKPTYAERRMMQRLDAANITYRDQAVIGWYIADILIAAQMIIIELDGQHHYSESREIVDFRRTQWLQQFGFSVVRVPNEKVEDFDISTLTPNLKAETVECSKALKAAKKERNRALYYAPVQQNQWKSNRNPTKIKDDPKDAWRKVPQINSRGRIVK